jgi:hypothetical protein
LEVVPLACLLCWYNNPNVFGLFASKRFSAQALYVEAQPDFLSGPSISMRLAILMIPVSSKGLGTYVRCPPPTYISSPKKIHFFAKLSILGVAFIRAFKSRIWALRGLVTLISTKFISSHNCWYTGMNLSARSSMKPTQVKFASTSGDYAFLLGYHSSTWSITKVTALKTLLSLSGFWTS